jgi:prevent-host-death family protein
MMESIVTATEARVRFGDMIRRVVENEEAIIVERGGKPQLVMLSLAQYEQLKAGYSTDWQEAIARTRAIAAEIRDRRGDKPLTPTPEEVIRQMREERDEQLHQHLP